MRAVLNAVSATNPSIAHNFGRESPDAPCDRRPGSL